MTPSNLDFAIVGAPKSGTTALYSYLKQRNDVFLPAVKEPHFFSTDMPGIRQISDQQEYDRLFANRPTGTLCGEASTSYLLSSEAVPSILRNNPNTKLIAMVRNPIDLVVAYHQQQLNGFVEDETDFAAAWRASPRRACGEAVPVGCRDPKWVAYGEVGRVGSQVQRLLKVAPQEQTHIIVFDDFVKDTHAVMEGTRAFLGLPPLEMREFGVVNERFQHRVPALSKLLMRPPPPFAALKRKLKRLFPEQARLVGDLSRSFTRKPVGRQPLSPELRRELAGFFQEEVLLLGRLLSRDLRHWLGAIDVVKEGA